MDSKSPTRNEHIIESAFSMMNRAKKSYFEEYKANNSEKLAKVREGLLFMIGNTVILFSSLEDFETERFAAWMNEFRRELYD